MRKVASAVSWTMATLLSVTLAGPTQSMAQAQNSNPLVEIYEQQWRMDQLEIKKYRLQLAFEERTLQRYKRLHDQRVLSRQQVEEQEIIVDTARLDIEVAQRKAAESESLVEVTRLRVENGLEVDICPND